LVGVETIETEAPIVPVITEKLKQIGMEVEVYETFNPRIPEKKRPCILGTLHGRKQNPLLGFNGHADVVPVEFPSKWKHSPFEPVVEGDKLYGRGACDMKGGLGSMIMAAKALVSAGIQLDGTLVIAAVPGEETGGWGSESTLKKKDWDAIVIGEPTELSINPACNGITTFCVKVNGKSSHASMPEKGINAIDKMLTVLNAFESYKERLSKRVHPLSGAPAFVSSIIEGGWRTVIVADECTLHITTHMIPGETTESRYSEVLEILDDLKKNDPDLEVNMLDWKGQPITLPLPKTGQNRPRLDPTEISVEEPVVQAMLNGSREALGKELSIGGSRYACDSPFYVNEGNIPTLALGPGNIEQAHTYDEWVDVQQLVEATKVYALGAMRFLGYS
jgi:acetylornithine deacetylase/succinyl-diaminopimelate desuccinylase family protein